MSATESRRFLRRNDVEGQNQNQQRQLDESVRIERGPLLHQSAGGNPFDFLPSLLDIFNTGPNVTARLASLEIWSGDLVDGIRASYEHKNEEDGTVTALPLQSLMAGSFGGTRHVLTLSEGEYIDKMYVCERELGEGFFRARVVSRVVFTTNLRPNGFAYGSALNINNQVCPPGPYVAPGGSEIVGFHGRDGSLIDALGPVLAYR